MIDSEQNRSNLLEFRFHCAAEERKHSIELLLAKTLHLCIDILENESRIDQTNDSKKKKRKRKIVFLEERLANLRSL